MTAALLDHEGPMTSDALVAASGCSYRQLDYWCRNGVLVPTLSTARPGSGGQRRWSRKDTRVVHVCARLAAMGATLPVLRHVAAMLRAFRDDEWAGSILVDEGGRVSRPAGEDWRARPVAAWLVDLDVVAARFTRAA
jgi:DNA-binding transcriptional MerR regulator